MIESDIKGNALKNIMVLEDNNELRELFTYLLEEEHYQVHSYPTAKSFWKGLLEVVPNMILLDVMLPDGNGLEICRKLKADEGTKRIPVMIMSAHAKMIDMMENCDAEEFLSKPFDIQNFIDKVHRQVN